MFEVTSGLLKFKFTFDHPHRQAKAKNRHTTCIMDIVYVAALGSAAGGKDGKEVAAYKQVARATPRCGDSYCYEDGRKAALKAVLKLAGMNREHRGKIWSAYFEAKHQARVKTHEFRIRQEYELAAPEPVRVIVDETASTIGTVERVNSTFAQEAAARSMHQLELGGGEWSEEQARAFSAAVADASFEKVKFSPFQSDLKEVLHQNPPARDPEEHFK